MLERLEDEEDSRIIEASKKHNAGKPLIPHEQIMREFGLTPGRSAPDFAAMDFGVDFKGRATEEQLSELGRRQMGF